MTDGDDVKVPPGFYVPLGSDQPIPIAQALREAADEIERLTRRLARSEARLAELKGHASDVAKPH